MFVLNENNEICFLKKSEVKTKETYYVLLVKDNFFEEETSKRLFVSNDRKITSDLSKAKKFKNFLEYTWWTYLHFTPPHLFINIAPYLEVYKKELLKEP